MANMTFKTNILPNSDAGYSLGSSDLHWNIYGDVVGNADTATAADLTTTTNAIAKYSDTAGTFADSGVTIDANNNVSASSFNGAKIFYGTCATAAGTARKDVVCADYTRTGAPVKGDIVFVTFDITNSASSPTLKVNNSTAKGIRYLGNATISALPSAGYLIANYPYRFVYNGSYWVVDLYYNTNSSVKQSASTTANWRKILLSYNSIATAGGAITNDTTNVSYYNDAIEVQCSTGTLKASIFQGSLNGNASTATSLQNAQTTYVNLSTASTSTTFQGGKNTAEILGVDGVLGVANGGTGLNSWTQWGVLYASAGTTLANTDAGTSGYVLTSNATSAPTWTTQKLRINNVSNPNSNTTTYYVIGVNATSGNREGYVETGIYFKSNVLYGAAWNDYAEYRQTDIYDPGRCVHECGNDTLALTTKRLEYGCEIISDTFGFAIGKTEKSQTPIAVTGRVLAYPYEPREEFIKHIGHPVCSGPNGTVSIMTEEEEKLYPSRIIGTISAVPDYEEWGENNVKVNGRVWIRIR